MDFRLLGPLEVLDGDRPLELGGTKQRALLALLLLQAGRRLSAARLIDELWGVQPPASAAKSLQMHVARLRRTLGEQAAGDAAGRVRTQQGGYLIRVAPGELDVDRFAAAAEEGRRLLAAGQPGQAAERLGQALAEWRGPALCDLESEPFAAAEIARLDELRLGALEDRIDADLACGRHAGAIAEIETLVAQHPFRERPRRQLMLALYRCGRAADALAAYRDARAELVESLGIEPGRGLRDLEMAILAQDPGLDWQPPRVESATAAADLPPRLRDAAARDLFGRTAELETLAGAWEQARAGERRVVLLTGEAGIGKTRVMAELARRAHGDGGTVLYGHCDDELPLPYLPWIDVLRRYIEIAPEAVIDRHTAAYGGELIRLVPELRDSRPGLAEPTASEPEAERCLMLRAVAGLIADAASDRPFVLLLDDLHWADEASLLVLRHVIAAGPASGALIVCAYRPSEIAGSERLARLVADLRRDPCVEALGLSGLEEADVAQLIRSRAAGSGGGTAGVDLARDVTRETNGNPFFVVELLRHIGEAGDAARAGAKLPDSVRDVVRRRVERLGEAAARILRVAAVIGVEFDLDVLTPATREDDDAVLDALDLAEHAELVAEVPDVRGRFRFAHALVAHALYEDMAATRRARMHARVAETLEVLAVGGGEPRRGELARHWTAAAREPERAIEWSRQAAEDALDKLAPDEAMAWFAHALELDSSRGDGDPTMRCNLMIGLGEAQRQTGEPRYRDTLLDACRLAREAGDGEGMARAVLANSRGFESAAGTVDPERVDNLRAALTLLRDPAERALRARLLALLQLEVTFAADLDERRALSDEAVGLAREAGDPATLAHVLWARHAVLWTPELLDEHVENAAQLTGLAVELGDPVVSFWAACDRALTSVWRADLAAADAAIATMDEIAERVGQPILRWVVTWYGAWRAHLAGRLDEAEERAQRAAELGMASGQPDAGAFLAEQLVVAAWDRGRLGDHVGVLEQAAEANPGLPVFSAWLALAYCEADRAGDARRVLSASADRRFDDVSRDIVWLTTLCTFAETATRLGAPEEAQVLYHLLAPFGDQVAFNASSVLGSVHRFLGQLATTGGRPDAAEAHFAQAAAVHESIGAPALLARTRCEWGLALLRAGDGGRASELLEQAAAGAAELGCDGIVRRIESAAKVEAHR